VPERGKGKTPVSIVAPCFNEELVLPFLANTLRSVQEAMREKYDVRFLFVDDGSTDDTWNSLLRIFGSRPECTLLRHETNRGVAAAILTGVRTAETEIVCSIDCDCSYDPHELKNMIPLLTENVDMVTASPYHPQGQVLNVPRWRLAMSKTLSFLYRRVLRQKLATYTSCFRVYRRSGSGLNGSGRVPGVAEMLGSWTSRGKFRYPATLGAAARAFQNEGLQDRPGTPGAPCPPAVYQALSPTVHAAGYRAVPTPPYRGKGQAMSHPTPPRERQMTLPSDQDASGRTLGGEELEALAAAIRSGTLTSTKGTFVKAV
jgi:hypothetical protein